MDDGANALLVTQQFDRDLTKSLTAELAMEGFERELRGKAQHLVDLAEQPCGPLDVAIDVLDNGMNALRLSTESGQALGYYLPLPLDRSTDVIREVGDSHCANVRT